MRALGDPQGGCHASRASQRRTLCEIPNNVILIDQFATRFDGFSIGSNDLTRLTLGVDRDSEVEAFDSDERHEGVKAMIRLAVEGCRRNGIHSGLCGQASSDYPDMPDGTFVSEQGRLLRSQSRCEALPSDTRWPKGGPFMTAKQPCALWPAQVRDLMSTEVVTVEPTATVKDVARLLVEHDIRMVPVVDIDDLLVGVVSEADLISREGYPVQRRHRLSERVELARDEHRHHWSARAEGVTAGEVMSKEVISCHPDEPIAIVTRRMLHDDIRTLPVVDAGRLVGVLSRHDIISLFDRPDPEIRDAAETMVNSAGWAPAGARVEVRVRDGVVTLEGSTRYEGDVSVMEAMVRNLPGVVGVTTLLTAEEKDPRVPMFGETDW